MSKCPFWSTHKKSIECSSTCPMNEFFSIKDNCPFKEYLVDTEIQVKDIEEGLAFEQEIEFHKIIQFDK